MHWVIDGHNDLPWELREQYAYDLDRVNLAAGAPEFHTDLPRLRAGGVGAQFWSVYVPGNLPADQAVRATLEQIDCVHALVARYPDQLALARTADEVETAHASGRIASLIGAEGGHSIGGSLAVLRMYAALGLRYLTLTHNHGVGWADSATDSPTAGGLSEFGIEVVRELNRLGVLVDLSHTADTTMRAALQATIAPVIFSHSSARALTEVPRNVPDDVLGALAGNGGVCMVTFVPMFVNAAVAAWQEQASAAAAAEGIARRDLDQFIPFIKAWEADHPGPKATVADVADHLDHVREIAGVDAVGLGGDYDGTPSFPVGLEDVSCYPALLAELRTRRWSSAELDALTHGNLLRVLRAAEDVAQP